MASAGVADAPARPRERAPKVPRIHVPRRLRNLELALVVLASVINGGALYLVQLGVLGAVRPELLHPRHRPRGPRARHARGAALAGARRGSVHPPHRHGAQRPGHRRDLPARPRRGAVRLGQRGRAADRLVGPRHRVRSRGHRAAQEPPRAAALPLHRHVRRPDPAAPADAPGPRPEHQRRTRLDPHRRLLVPARRDREDLPGDLLRRLPGHRPRQPVDGRRQGPRDALPAHPRPRPDPPGLGRVDERARLPARPRHLAALLRPLHRHDLREHGPHRLGRARPRPVPRRRVRREHPRLRRRPRRRLAEPVRPRGVRRERRQLPARHGPVRHGGRGPVRARAR